MAQLATKKVLTLEAAREIARAAQAEARRNGWNVVIAVVDDGGHLMYQERMDGTQVASVIEAQEKAACAIRFKRPTKRSGWTGGHGRPDGAGGNIVISHRGPAILYSEP